MYIETTIEHQKHYAKSILLTLNAALEETSTRWRVVLAGGAVRNWDYGRPCNDLDFYIYKSYEYSEGGRGRPHNEGDIYNLITEKLSEMGGNPGLIEPDPENAPQYDGNMLSYVIDTGFPGDTPPVQVMICRPSSGLRTINEIFGTFDTSICKIALTHQMHYLYDPYYVLGKLYDIVLITKDFSIQGTSRRHLDKMKGYFPELPFFDVSRLQSRLQTFLRKAYQFTKLVDKDTFLTAFPKEDIIEMISNNRGPLKLDRGMEGSYLHSLTNKDFL